MMDDITDYPAAKIITEEDLGRPIHDFCEGEWADEHHIRWALDGEYLIDIG